MVEWGVPVCENMAVSAGNKTWVGPCSCQYPLDTPCNRLCCVPCFGLQPGSCPEVFLRMLLRTGIQYAEFGAGACLTQAAALPLWPTVSQRVALVVHLLRVAQQQGLVEPEALHRELQGIDLARLREPSAAECDDGRVASVNVGVMSGVVVDVVSEVGQCVPFQLPLPFLPRSLLCCSSDAEPRCGAFEP